jgi:hypothetical protein
MITKFVKFNLITESPDCVEVDDDKDNNFLYSDAEAIPFFASVDKDYSKILRMNVGKHGDKHNDMLYKGKNKAFAGRLWLYSRIISFWVYPNIKLFKQIIKQLEKKLKIKLFNNHWRIEVIIDNNGNINREEYDSNLNNDNFFRPDEQIKGDNQLISIEDYIGSQDQPEELRIQHMLNWKEKEKKKTVVKGFGSDKTGWDKPHNIKYKQAIYQENKNSN